MEIWQTHEPKFDQLWYGNQQTYSMDTMEWDQLNLFSKILKKKTYTQIGSKSKTKQNSNFLNLMLWIKTKIK